MGDPVKTTTCAAPIVAKTPEPFIVTDPREIELREGIRFAASSGMREQEKLYRAKLKEYLEGQEPGLFLKREADLLGGKFFEKFPLIELKHFVFTLPELKADVSRKHFGGRIETAHMPEVKRESLGFEVEVAPGVSLFYPYVTTQAGASWASVIGNEDHSKDYSKRMVPVAGLSLVREAKESGWFPHIRILDPVDLTKLVDDEKATRQKEFEQLKQMLEHDPLVVGIGLDDRPRKIYHWIGEDEQALTHDEIQKQVKGLEAFVNAVVRRA